VIDLILRAPDRATLVTFARNNGLMEQVVLARDTDPDSPTYGEPTETEWRLKKGVDYCWWAGSGQMMRSRGTYDEEGNQLTAPTFVPGVVAIMRLYADFFNEDRIEAEPDAEQWARSKVVKYIKDNGVIGQIQGIAYAELDGVQVFRPADVVAKLAEWGVAGHEWMGGNRY